MNLVSWSLYLVHPHNGAEWMFDSIYLDQWPRKMVPDATCDWMYYGLRTNDSSCWLTNIDKCKGFRWRERVRCNMWNAHIIMSVKESESDYERNELQWLVICWWELFYKVWIYFMAFSSFSVNPFPYLQNAHARRSRQMCCFAHLVACRRFCMLH